MGDFEGLWCGERDREMSRNWTFFIVLALMLAGNIVCSTPSSAEFFGCNDKNSVSYRSTSGHFAQATGRTTHEFAAQSARPRVTIYPRRTRLSSNSVRQCRATLVKEYRASGTVIVPRMQCWWE
jgi:hypothetical protein